MIIEARKILVELWLKMHEKKCVFQNCCKKRTIFGLNRIIFFIKFFTISIKMLFKKQKNIQNFTFFFFKFLNFFCFFSLFSSIVINSLLNHLSIVDKLWCIDKNRIDFFEILCDWNYSSFFAAILKNTFFKL